MIDLLFLLYKGIYEMIILICMVKGDSMKKYIAFLRGINISGKNKIRMSDLNDDSCNIRTGFLNYPDT